MTRDGRTGILGGTFDPIHVGHLAAAEAARAALGLDQVLVVPSAKPPHRPSDPRASAFHRFAMVSLAVASHPAFVAEDLELRAQGPSFTAVTLDALRRAGYRGSQLFFIAGVDAFAEIATWHAYPEVLDLAHFAVILRPGGSFDSLRDRVPAVGSRLREVTGVPADADLAAPAVFLVHAVTPDVSSTDIRARAGRGEPLAGLVPDEVARHIARHRLYASGETVHVTAGRHLA